MFIPNLPQSDGFHEFYACVTLVDITKTDAVRYYNKGMDISPKEYETLRNQHRNWQTILQVINLRSQPVYLTDPKKMENQPMSDFDFGSNFTGNHTVWVFTFGTEHSGIFDLPHQPLGGLLNDLHHVPIITHLTETAEISPMVFDSLSSDNKNILILK